MSSLFSFLVHSSFFFLFFLLIVLESNSWFLFHSCLCEYLVLYSTDIRLSIFLAFGSSTIMQFQSLLAYIFVVVFAMTVVLAQANKEREQFADLLQKRKHLNGYWVGKRYALSSDEEPYLESGKQRMSIFRLSIHFYRWRSISSQTSVVPSRQTWHLFGRQTCLVSCWT